MIDVNIDSDISPIFALFLQGHVKVRNLVFETLCFRSGATYLNYI